MKVVFMGTPEFALPSFEAVLNKYGIIAAVCQPDREKDRKGNVIFPPIKQAAQKYGVPLFQFSSIKKEGVDVLKELAPDIVITCAYGQIISQEILDIPKYGVLNVHASLLPAYRGSAPIQRALMGGETVTGVTIMKTELGMDTGDIISKVEVAIRDEYYLADLFDVLSRAGAELLINTIDDYVAGKIMPIPQVESDATYAPRIKKEDSYLDFNNSAMVLRNQIRGTGFGICLFNDTLIKILNADVVDLSDAVISAGNVVECNKNGITVACGQGGLRINILQPTNKKALNPSEFINGYRPDLSSVFSLVKGN